MQVSASYVAVRQADFSFVSLADECTCQNTKNKVNK